MPHELFVPERWEPPARQDVSLGGALCPYLPPSDERVRDPALSRFRAGFSVRAQVASSGQPATAKRRGRASACDPVREMKPPRVDPRLRELLVLAALAAFGWILALARGDLMFLAIFGAANVVIIDAIRRLR